MCHKLDPDRNGFISTPSVILAFSQLTPLSDRSFVSHLTSSASTASANVGSTFNAEFGELLLLSVATNTMVRTITNPFFLICMSFFNSSYI